MVEEIERIKTKINDRIISSRYFHNVMGYGMDYLCDEYVLGHSIDAPYNFPGPSIYTNGDIETTGLMTWNVTNATFVITCEYIDGEYRIDAHISMKIKDEDFDKILNVARKWYEERYQVISQYVSKVGEMTYANMKWYEKSPHLMNRR